MLNANLSIVYYSARNGLSQILIITLYSLILALSLSNRKYEVFYMRRFIRKLFTYNDYSITHIHILIVISNRRENGKNKEEFVTITFADVSLKLKRFMN